jgi:hypothetical protein
MRAALGIRVDVLGGLAMRRRADGESLLSLVDLDMALMVVRELRIRGLDFVAASR